MDRSAVDATRFTSTSPHASTKPSTQLPNLVSSRSVPPRTAGRPGETPQEKVKRLREAAARARESKISAFDKVIIVGRVWADRAHRFTALSLIGLTGIAGVVTVYALGDMIMYNRQKRAEYYAEQRALHSAAVHEAQEATALGTATELQQALIKKEETLKQGSEAGESSKQPGIFARSKAWLFSGLKKEEEVEDFSTPERRLGYEGISGGDNIPGERESDILRAIEKEKREVRAKAEMAFEGERKVGEKGGLLDRLDTGTETGPTTSSKEAPKSGGWAAFISRR